MPIDTRNPQITCDCGHHIAQHSKLAREPAKGGTERRPGCAAPGCACELDPDAVKAKAGR